MPVWFKVVSHTGGFFSILELKYTYYLEQTSTSCVNWLGFKDEIVSLPPSNGSKIKELNESQVSQPSYDTCIQDQGWWGQPPPIN